MADHDDGPPLPGPHCSRKVWRQTTHAEDYCARPVWRDFLCALHHPERMRARRAKRKEQMQLASAVNGRRYATTQEGSNATG